MEIKAIHRDAHIFAQKMRLVADQTHGLLIERALNILTFSPKRAAGIVKEVVESTVASAEHSEDTDTDELKIRSIYIGKITSLKRLTARAKGRGNRIEKQTCHIIMTLGS